MSLDDVYVPDVIPESDIEYFEKSGFGTRMGWGDSPALLIVDMTVLFTRSEYSLGRGDTGQRAVKAIGELAAVARETDTPVIYTRPASGTNTHQYVGVWTKKMDSYPDSREASEIDPHLEPNDDDIVIDKGTASPFSDTRLERMLRYMGIDTMIVTGMVTSGCVRAAAVDACAANFHVIVPKECVADRAKISHEVALFELDLKYGDVSPLTDIKDKLHE